MQTAPNESTDVSTLPKKSFPRQLFSTFLLSMLSFMTGVSIAYPSVALISPDFTEKIYLSPSEKSWITGFLPLFAVFGGLLAGIAIDKVGRKPIIISSNLLFLASYLILGITNKKYQLYIARVLIGLAVGSASIVTPIYVCEITDSNTRGSLGILTAAIGNLGVVICYVLGAYLHWKILSFTLITPTVILIILFKWMPESPIYWIMKKKGEKCIKVLLWLYKNQKVDGIYETMKYTEMKLPFRRKYCNKAVVKPVFILSGLMFIQQMTGINAVLAYSITIFKLSGSSIDSHISTIILGAVNFFSTFIAAFIISFVGRKVLLTASCAVVIVMLIFLGLYFHFLGVHPIGSELKWIPLLCLVVYVIGFSFGLGPVPWLMMGELLPRTALPSGSFVIGFNYICCFLVTKGFSDIAEYIGIHWGFWSFSIVCTFGVVFISTLVPETKGKSLEDIQDLLKRRTSYLRYSTDIVR